MAVTAAQQHPQDDWESRALELRPILRLGNPALLEVSKTVSEIGALEIQHYIRLLLKHQEHYKSSGIAAPQIGIPYRIVVFHAPEHREGGEIVPLTVAINPEVIWESPETVRRWEACLSTPGLICEVERPQHIRYKFSTPEGQEITREATGFHAKVFQHEHDHLDGILAPHKMNGLKRFGYIDEMRQFVIE